MSCDRGGCPLYPEDGGAHPGLRDVPSRRLPLPSGQSLQPRSNIPSCEGSASRGINEGSSNSPVRSSPRPRPPGWNGPPLGLSPELRTPPTRSRRRTSRWGQAIEHGPGTTRSTSHQLILQSCSSLTACDLASQRQRCASPTPSTVRRSDRPHRLPSFAVITGVAGVLAAGVIRDDLQAHLALARVGEQPPSSTPTSLPVRTSSTTLGRPTGGRSRGLVDFVQRAMAC